MNSFFWEKEATFLNAKDISLNGFPGIVHSFLYRFTLGSTARQRRDFYPVTTFLGVSWNYQNSISKSHSHL